MHFSDGKTTRVCKVTVVPSQTYPVEPILDFSLKKSKITSILNESDETTVNDNIVSQTVDYVSYNYFFSGDSFSHLEITWDYFSFVMLDDYILLKERYEPYQGHSNKYVDRYNTFTIERKLGSHIYKPI